MQKTKRKRRGKGIGCLNKKKDASKTVLTQRPIHPDITSEDECDNMVKFCESSSSELTKQIESQLSESVVALASFIGDTVAFQCTGIFIENSCADTTSILTSANLVGSLHHGITDNLTIKVRLPSDRVVIGWLHHCDFKFDLAVVNIRRARGFLEAHLSSSHRVQFESNSMVVAVGRCFDSGMLNFTYVTVIGSASYEISELKMNTYLIGWPLIDFDGNFVGVNLRRGKRTAFVPMNKILEFLGYSGTTRLSAADTNDKHGTNRLSAADTFFCGNSAADTNDKPGSNSAADTNYKRGLNSWKLLYGDQDVPEERDLDLFPLDQSLVFYDREEDASAMMLH